MKYGGLKFLEAAHVKDLLAVLRWAENPRNQLAALRTLQLLPGMGPVNARAVLESFAAAGSTAGALRAVAVPPRCQEGFAPLVELIEALGGPERPWPGQMRRAVDWYAPHLERIYEQHLVRRGDLEQLEQLSAQFATRERFLTELTLDPPQATSDLAGDAQRDEDYLVLSTVHSAKGMEWDTVFVLNVVDGSFPSEFATGKAESLAEERRLLYVAMTRARDELQLLQPLVFPLTQQAPRGDAHVYGGRSRFMTAPLMARFEHSAYGAARPQELPAAPAAGSGVDAASRIRDMW
jgi:DNA helicase-2/ATP-dependent DNA helicase PcrA